MTLKSGCLPRSRIAVICRHPNSGSATIIKECRRNPLFVSVVKRKGTRPVGSPLVYPLGTGGSPYVRTREKSLVGDRSPVICDGETVRSQRVGH